MFLNSIKSLFTKTTYANALKLYLQDMGVQDPNQLISPELLEQPSEVRKLEDHIIAYILHLQKEENLSYATINTRLAGISHFYIVNRVNLNKEYIAKFKGQKKRVSKDTAYTRQQIQQILATSDLRQKVIILLLASTGMRIGALPTLKLQDLKRINIDGDQNQYLYKITVYDMEPEEYYTFTTFECAQAIDEYLAFRKRFGEVLKPNAPLIRMKFDRFTILQAKDPKPISHSRFQLIVDEILIQAGIKERIPMKETEKKKSHRHSAARAHGFRKFTVTQMIKAKLDYETREYLVGHRRSRGLDEQYDRTTVDDRLQEYLKVVDLVTISPENRLRKQVAEQQNALTQVHELAKQIELIKNVIQKDQAQVRKVRSSSDFKKKVLQKG